MLYQRLVRLGTLFFLIGAVAGASTNSTCHLIYELPNNEQCSFALEHCADHQLGYLNLFKLYYCTSSWTLVRQWLILPLVVAILLYLFAFLGLTASEYLCANLSTLSAYLKIPENISGLTLLAFGNGSPDLVSTYSSFQTNNPSLAIGELIGAAFFITSFIVGSITIAHPFDVIPQFSADSPQTQQLLVQNAKFVYLRDVSFFLFSMITLVACLLNGHLSTVKLNILITIYLTYVCVVLIWQYLFSQKKKELIRDYTIRNSYNDEPFIVMDGDNLEFEDTYTFHPGIINSIEFGKVLDGLSQKQSVPFNLASFVNDSQNYESRLTNNHISLPDDEIESQSTIKTIFNNLAYPLVMILTYNVPVVPYSMCDDSTKPNLPQLYKILVSLSLAECTIFLSFFNSPSWQSWLVFFAIAPFPVFGVYYNLIRAQKQSNLVKLFLCVVGFVTAIAFIAQIADELINVLKFISVLTNMSDVIMGLTIFAIGNSVGDLISNLVIASLGYPLMALAACFGGPLLNLLLGVGVNGKIMGQVNIDIKWSFTLTCTWIILVLVFMLVYIPLNNWRFTRQIGIGLVLVWVLGTYLNIQLELI
ncbi:hypothetical protein OGAPHI_006762 [Ogataea philodendri]|uniref:Sodium/calcium exchanger membrane region domain-containing protein n=1 Tax=Ogataea philodendri TaxID=1378263 RepID=A0A9P8T0Y8_9ASCO|nr:uncharacterized protein OGAPHI_006762 [Ogataea philodendri]KAH3661355.1 hypothetical protein OGAPHI_006762 [Ogataea philodendri]